MPKSGKSGRRTQKNFANRSGKELEFHTQNYPKNKKAGADGQQPSGVPHTRKKLRHKRRRFRLSVENSTVQIRNIASFAKLNLEPLRPVNSANIA